MPNDRLQYEFSDSLGGNYFDLRFNQGDELGEWLRVYIAPELQRHVSPEGIASCINNALTLFMTQGVVNDNYSGRFAPIILAGRGPV